MTSLSSTSTRSSAIEIELSSLLKIANTRITVLEAEILSFTCDKPDLDYLNSLRTKFNNLTTELSELNIELMELKETESLTMKKYQLKCLEVEE